MTAAKLTLSDDRRLTPSWSCLLAKAAERPRSRSSRPVAVALEGDDFGVVDERAWRRRPHRRRPHPSTRKICLIGTPSARRSRRISAAQSSRDNTSSGSPGSTRAMVSGGGPFQLSPGVSFQAPSTQVSNHGCRTTPLRETGPRSETRPRRAGAEAPVRSGRAPGIRVRRHGNGCPPNA